MNHRTRTSVATVFLMATMLIAACSNTASSDAVGTSSAPEVGSSTPPGGGLGTRPPVSFGAPVGDVRCDLGGHDEAYHIHATFSVIVAGQATVADPNIGLGTTPDGQPCMYWAHTHEEPGRLVHIEAPEDVAVTLGDFIAVWRATYPDSQLLATTLTDLAAGRYTLDGAPGPIDWASVPLRDMLAIVVG